MTLTAPATRRDGQHAVAAKPLGNVNRGRQRLVPLESRNGADWQESDLRDACKHRVADILPRCVGDTEGRADALDL